MAISATHFWIRLVFAGVLCALASPAHPAVGAAEEAKAPDPIESGRDGLRGGKFVWYDRDTDDLRRITIKPPDPSTTTSTSTSVSPATAQIASGGVQMLIWTLIAVLLGGLAYVLITAFLNRETSASDTTASQESVAEVDRTEALPIPIERDISNLLAAARKAYEQGNYRLAIVYLYSHQLVELDKHQVIHLSKGKTNRQYLREVTRAGRRALGGLLEKTQVVFEEAFFGGRSIGPEEFDPCWAALGEFDRLVREVPR